MVLSIPNTLTGRCAFFKPRFDFFVKNCHTSVPRSVLLRENTERLFPVPPQMAKKKPPLPLSGNGGKDRRTFRGAPPGRAEALHCGSARLTLAHNKTPPAFVRSRAMFFIYFVVFSRRDYGSRMDSSSAFTKGLMM